MNMWRRRQHREVAMIWLTEEKRYGDGGLLSGVVLARSHPSSTLYFGIVILCTVINKAWFTYIYLYQILSDSSGERWLPTDSHSSIPSSAARDVTCLVSNTSSEFSMNVGGGGGTSPVIELPDAVCDPCTCCSICLNCNNRLSIAVAAVAALNSVTAANRSAASFSTRICRSCCSRSAYFKHA